MGVMDLSTKTWGSIYDANVAPYEVTQDAETVVGGTYVLIYSP